MNTAEANQTERIADAAPPNEPKAKGNFRRVTIVIGLIILVGLVVGFIPRWRERERSQADSSELAIPTVSVVSPAPGDAGVGLILPADIKPLQEASIYARASGYLKRWLVDIGARVEAGQLLAEIDTPELDQQLDQARAQLSESEAAMKLAKTTAERWSALLKTASVSEQENAEKQADFSLKSATVEAQRANVRRLEEVKGFQRVVAPFAGTITSRTTDIGDLIASGSGRELFHLAQTEMLRVYVRVPQAAARGVAVGQLADVLIPEIPNQTFPAKVVTTSGAMTASSRTLLTELRVENPKNTILADSFAQVRFAEPNSEARLTLPANTLLFRAEGLQVGVVQSNNAVQLRKVEIGRDFGKTIEIISGVTPEDQVIANPKDSLVSGTIVRIAEAPKVEAAK